MGDNLIKQKHRQSQYIYKLEYSRYTYHWRKLWVNLSPEEGFKPILPFFQTYVTSEVP